MIGDILQPSHLLFILVIALLVLGPKRLPEVARGLGKGMRDFRNALRENDPREELAQVTQHVTAPVEMTAPAAAPVPTVPPVPTPAAAQTAEPVPGPVGAATGQAAPAAHALSPAPPERPS